MDRMKFRFVKVLTFENLIQFSLCFYSALNLVLIIYYYIYFFMKVVALAFFKILENITPNKVNKARFQYFQPRLTVFTCGTKAKEN